MSRGPTRAAIVGMLVLSFSTGVLDAATAVEPGEIFHHRVGAVARGLDGRPGRYRAAQHDRPLGRNDLVLELRGIDAA